ncbi:MAG TPA: bacterioferritin [Egibacteraceae bacterium]|nr:bacterioferritin [Actinomycetota bacterium]HWB71390.1 bacterioferritin [Egibacteraceae bacterium]
MQGSPKVIEFLNEALTAELTAINQYFVASKMAANWGYDKLARHVYDESLGEMRHAESVIERIILLEGVPNLQRLFPVRVGETVVEQFELDLEMEREAVQRYRRGIGVCSEEGDPATRVFLEAQLVAEEEHVDWLETQFVAIEQLGFANYMLKWV